jgi:hypothetical protein
MGLESWVFGHDIKVLRVTDLCETLLLFVLRGLDFKTRWPQANPSIGAGYAALNPRQAERLRSASQHH